MYLVCPLVLMLKDEMVRGNESANNKSSLASEPTTIVALIKTASQ